MGSLFPILRIETGHSWISLVYEAPASSYHPGVILAAKAGAHQEASKSCSSDRSAGTSERTASRRVHDHDPVMRVSSQLRARCLESTPSYSLSAQGPCPGTDARRDVIPIHWVALEAGFRTSCVSYQEGPCFGRFLCSHRRFARSSTAISTFRIAFVSFVRRTHFLAISAVQQDASWYCVQYLSWAGNSVGVEKGLCISFWR
mmetsp:Transcript_4165/g.26374  ORF Transcript_4165/g.26374 Transcript_4165/m.26374 type:complete len:202 (+) Transcript_4165:3013-3618(+)